MEDDEALARKLQQQFDAEDQSLQQREDTDLAMAKALSMGHSISDSEEEDSDESRESPSLLRSLKKKSENTNCNAVPESPPKYKSAEFVISDSDDSTDDEVDQSGSSPENSGFYGMVLSHVNKQMGLSLTKDNSGKSPSKDGRPSTSKSDSIKWKTSPSWKSVPSMSKAEVKQRSSPSPKKTVPSASKADSGKSKASPSKVERPSTSKSDSVKRNASPSRKTVPGMSKVDIVKQKSSPSRDEIPSTSKPDGVKRKATPSKDERPMCKYGSECYRRNKWHMEEFRHPDEDNNTPVSKKRKIDTSKQRTTEDSSRPSMSSSASLRSCPDIIQHASPLCFLLTKVSGISSQYNGTKAVHISDILTESMGELVESVQFNYMHDISWLVEQYPKKFRSKPLLLVHGEQREGKIRLQKEASAYSHIQLCQARLEIMWGTHHSKMMLLLYTNGMRVVIHTANLIHQDWHQKTQGVWISPLFPKLSGGSAGGSMDAGESPTHFKRDLIEYLAAYKVKPLVDWIGHIKKHDMSSAKVHIIGSVPGRHVGETKSKWGHMKMRKILKNSGPTSKDVSDWPVIGQYSSVGSLGPDKSKWLCAEFLQSMSAVQGVSTSLMKDDRRMLKLIFPSRDNIRTSLEGYPAGGSVPYSINTAKKQPYLNAFLHQWKANKRGRSRASPHIKTYSRVSPDNSSIPWFLVTSSNLSKAAWGALEKNGSQLMIRSYEIGVLFLPQHFVSESKFFTVGDQASSSSSSSNKQLVFPLPWDVPLVPYTKEDRPWIWDIPYLDKPDSHGNVWAPHSR